MLPDSAVQRNVFSVRGECTLRGAARLMTRHGVGSLVITAPDGERPQGIVTDRDLVAMLAEGLDPDTASVGCLAQKPLIFVRIGDDIDDVTRHMREKGVRRLPVLDARDRLIGIVALDDVLALLGRELADLSGAVGTGIEHERSLQAIRGGPARV